MHSPFCLAPFCRRALESWPSCFLWCAGLVAVDFPGSGARDDSGGLAVDDELEVAVLGDPGNGLAGVDHADLDFLGGDHDAAALRDAPLDGDGAGRPAAARRR